MVSSSYKKPWYLGWKNERYDALRDFPNRHSDTGQKMISVIEKRSMQRFNLKLAPLIKTMGSAEDVIKEKFVTKNICANGAYFITSEPFLLGTEVQIDLVWPPIWLQGKEDRKILIQLSGEVSRIDEKGMAIAFKSNYRFIPGV